jgi:hypothetical protein
MRKLFPWILALVAAAAVTSKAEAQSVGVRAGASVDPDQFYIGGHVETPAIVDHVHLRPNLEVGFGDHVTLVAVNIEAVYKYPLHRSPWTLYGGGGPAINYYNFENDVSDTEGGFNFVGGLENDRGLFFEIKFGAWDSPDLKFGVGYTFGRH